MKKALLPLLLCVLVFPAVASAKDNDRMPTRWEKKYKLNPNKNDGHLDPDFDGLSNLREYRLRINPRSSDTDRDGMQDGVEVRFGFNPRRDDAAGDKDGDGISNLDEAKDSDDSMPTDPPGVSRPEPDPPESPGLFVVDCGRTERKNLDPIIAPGRPGAVHSHDFFGPQTVEDSDLPADLIKRPTSCGFDGDRSAYWMPSLYNGDQLQEGDVLQAYYNINSRTRAYPKGLSVIAGKPNLTVTNPQSASWSCQPSSNFTETSVPPCPSSQFIVAIVRFPPCWNGRDLDSPDHRSHMSYPQEGRCPASHPVELPELVLFRAYTQYEGLLDRVSLASGSAGGLHADFVSGWDEAQLTNIINSCRGRNCGRIGRQVLPRLPDGTPRAASLRSRKSLLCRLSGHRFK